MAKFSRRAAARPDELAAAALELCAERGTQATRVADVAERAGVTVGTIYRYFRDKDELIGAAMKLSPQLAPKPVVDRPGAALPALAEALRRWGAFFSETGLRAVRVALSDPRLDAANSETPVREAISEITAIIAGGIERKDVRSDLDAAAVAQSLVGALLLGPMFRGAASSDKHADVVSALAVRGLRADGPSWRP